RSVATPAGRSAKSRGPISSTSSGSIACRSAGLIATRSTRSGDGRDAGAARPTRLPTGTVCSADDEPLRAVTGQATLDTVALFVALIAAGAIVSLLDRRVAALPDSVALVLLGLGIAALAPLQRITVTPELVL